MDKLWRAVDGPGAPPQVDGRRVRARVNAALDAGCPERKIYMKKKLSLVLAVAAALAIMGTAFAAVVDWDASALLLARLRTSSATTAKPLPAAPARAASTAAFSARMLV